MRHLIGIAVLFTTFLVSCEQQEYHPYYYWEAEVYDLPGGVPYKDIHAYKIDARTKKVLERRKFEELKGWDPRSVRDWDFNHDGGSDFTIYNRETKEYETLYSSMPPPSQRQSPQKQRGSFKVMYI